MSQPFRPVPALSLTGVGLVHPNGHRALSCVSLSVSAGERLAVIGPSGAGKTTLLRLASAALRPSEGCVGVLGGDPWHMGARELRRLRARVGVVHQAPPIPPQLRVITAVLAGRLGAWSTWRAIASLAYPRDIAGAREVLGRLDLADRLFDRCDRLSGGQLQRVGLARVLYQQPQLMLADEPVSALDPTLADAAVGALVAQSERTGATLCASLHAVDLALKWFPRIVGMRAGVIVFDAPAQDVTHAMLADLYANEGTVLPTQSNDPATLAALARHPGQGDAPGEGGPGSASILPFPRPGRR